MKRVVPVLAFLLLVTSYSAFARDFTLFKDDLLTEVPTTVNEYGAGRLVTISDLKLSQDGLSGTVSIQSKDTDFILVISVKADRQLVAAYKDLSGGFTIYYNGTGKKKTITVFCLSGPLPPTADPGIDLAFVKYCGGDKRMLPSVSNVLVKDSR